MHLIKSVSPNRCSPTRDREDEVVFPNDSQASFRVAHPSFNRFRDIASLRRNSTAKGVKLRTRTTNLLKNDLIYLLAYSLLIEGKGEKSGKWWGTAKFNYLREHCK